MLFKKKKKRQKIESVGKNVEKREHSHTVGGIVNLVVSFYSFAHGCPVFPTLCHTTGWYEKKKNQLVQPLWKTV